MNQSSIAAATSPTVDPVKEAQAALITAWTSGPSEGRVETMLARVGDLVAALSTFPQAAEPSPAQGPVAWPEKWSGPITVGNMIANLATLPADMPVHTAYHIIREGQPSLLRVKRPTLSRERCDGLTIKTDDESVPYSAVIWAHPREPDATPQADVTGLVGRWIALAETPFAPGGLGHELQQRGDAYLADYVLSTDGADYEPSENERFLLTDAFAGLLSDEALFGPVRTILAALAARPSHGGAS